VDSSIANLPLVHTIEFGTIEVGTIEVGMVDGAENGEIISLVDSLFMPIREHHRLNAVNESYNVGPSTVNTDKPCARRQMRFASF